MINASYVFLKSAFEKEGAFIHNVSVVEWLKNQNEAVKVDISRSSFDKLKGWHYNKERGCIIHESGKFFSIEGIDIKTNWGTVNHWQQPIINQPEIGYLGFIAKEFNGVLHFLVQAKIEPGNVNNVQLSPTLQATRSNYNQVHKGRQPLYLEYFQKATADQILLDQLQSEQGARFLRKRNRNIIIKVEGEVPVHENFIWLTVGQIKNLMQFDNLVNMDTRTVISGIPYGNYTDEVIELLSFLRKDNNPDHIIKNELLRSTLSIDHSVNSIEDIISFITATKSIYDLEITSLDLKKMDGWIFDHDEIYHEKRKYFRVIGVDVEIGNREVVRWSQPMIEPAQEGLCAFVCKKINGILHFAAQAKLECGNHDIVELAPTVQCLTGNYRNTPNHKLPFLEYVLNAPKETVLIDSIQSEEGGRFFKEQNRNMVVLAGDEVSDKLPEKFIWMTLNQLTTFLKFNNFLNIQARSLIAAINFS